MPGVQVRLYNAGDDPASPSSVPVMETTTASDGSFLLTTYLEGSYFIHIPPSQFAAFAPLDSHVSIASFGADDGDDDDVGENGIDAADPAVTGINSAGFDLMYGTEPVDEAAETGFLATSDNGSDADTDLTLDFGFVTAPGGPSGSTMRRDLSGSSASPSSFAAWQTQNGMGGLNNPNDDPDFDGLSNLMEYALGSAADHGLHAARFVLETNAAIDAIVTRPAGDHADLRYTLEGSSDLTAWTALTITPVVTTNANQTQTLRYANVDGMPFLRLKVTLDADLNGTAEASAFTPVQSWARRDLPVGRQTLSMPLARASIFSGKVASLSGSIVTLNTGGIAVGSLMQSGTSYYIEALDGALAGRTYDITSTSGSSITLSGAVDAALLGARISLRPHQTLGTLLPAAVLLASATEEDADRVLFYDSTTNSFQIYWLRAAATGAQWVRAGDASLADASARIIAPQEGMLVQVRSTPVALTLHGEVRSAALAPPQAAGTRLIGTGLSVPLAPGAQSHTVGARIRLWSGDTDPASATYQNYLLNEQSQWIEEATGVDVTTQPILDVFRAYFLVKGTSG